MWDWIERIKWPDLFGWKKELEQNAAIFKAIERRVASMNLEEAKETATALLRDPAKYKLTPLRAPLPDVITGVTREVLSEFVAPWALLGSVSIEESTFGESELKAGHYRIGYLQDFTELVVSPGSDEVTWLESESVPGDVLRVYPTLYHYVVEDHLHSTDPTLNARVPKR